MMPAFESGKLFKFKYRLVSPNRGVPWVNFEVFGMDDDWHPCHGKVDTGATLTILTKERADKLIMPPDDDEERDHIETATGEIIDFYHRRVQVRFERHGQKHFYHVGFAFNNDLKRNLLGKDWLNEFCLVFDSRSVSFIEECDGRRPPCPPPQPYNKICVIPPEFD
jgi:predicted aspartyl protease